MKNVFAGRMERGLYKLVVDANSDRVLGVHLIGPDAPEILWRSVKAMTDNQIDKVTHLNAMRIYQFPIFDHFKREEITVGALRAKAKAAGVDTAIRSSGGAAPLAAGEARRAVTSGDIGAMFKAHAEMA